MRELPQHITGETVHARRGAVGNVFRYSVDYLLIDPKAEVGPLLFSRRGRNLMVIDDKDHGGPRGAGQGVRWAERVLTAHGCDVSACRTLLLAQPSCFGFSFSPVSFWMAMQGDSLIAVIAEVNNTEGDRHSYLCRKPGFQTIAPGDTIAARKIFHVSPFQDVDGRYSFSFSMGDDRIAIRIGYFNGDEGVIATLRGARGALTNRSILRASLRRPAGALRVLGLIYWQAIRLKLKRVRYRQRPEPPKEEVS